MVKKIAAVVGAMAAVGVGALAAKPDAAPVMSCEMRHGGELFRLGDMTPADCWASVEKLRKARQAK
jgi:hypothetical protein